jgi:hypothetical protein
VNTRYEERRSIVLTTNLDHSQLAEQIGERIVSRLVEMCGDPIPLYGQDHRRELRLSEERHIDALQGRPSPAVAQPAGPVDGSSVW